VNKLNLYLTSKGFSLIEILIALVILSISLLALAGLMVTTTQNTSFGSHLTEAATFAQDRLEEFRAMRWQDIPPTPGPDLQTGSTGINYSRSWNVVQNGNLKTITVTINWNDRKNHSISLLSVISQ
jgi:type IV pilus assembly protein PilV